jgi:hypothetical protein
MKTFDEMEKELWPQTCPSCGYKAYIGANEVKCITVQSCRNFDEKECQRWVDLRDELEPVECWVDEQHRQLWIDDTPLTFTGGGGMVASTFDWRDYVLNTTPLNPTAQNRWEYQLPAGESKHVYIGDSLTDPYGRVFRVSKMDRTTDKITIISWP